MYNHADNYPRGTYKQPRRNVPRRIIWVAILLVTILVIAAVAIRSAYNRQLQPVNDSQKVVLLTIKPGTASTEIGNQLYEEGLIRSSTMFQWYIRTENVRDKMQAGTYALRPSMSVQEIVTVLVEGAVKSDLVTILPGQRIDQIRQTLINAGFQPGAVDAALQPGQYAGHVALVDKPAEASLEGFIYPDSYQKNDNTDPATIVKDSLDEMATYLTPDIRSAFATQGLSVYQGVILASIVEREVSNPADSPIVAQVFLKRLKIDMQLGSDVTGLYGSIIAGKAPSLTHLSPYNTHVNKGLPPTPISNFGKTSLEAVAKPSQTGWLYFVAGDDGKTYFSDSLEDHEALTDRHCKKLCSL